MKNKLVVLDFDKTITNWDGTLKKRRADLLAKHLQGMWKKYSLKTIVILSMATKAHILQVVMESRSTSFLELVQKCRFITIENRSMVIEMDRGYSQSHTKKKNMIDVITNRSADTNSMHHIIAYKKANALILVSKYYKVQPHNIFYLDDNEINVLFAGYFGFRSFLVNNKPNHPELHLLQRLKTISNILDFFNAHHKYPSEDVLHQEIVINFS
jgi:hypothetical protein